MVKTILNGQTNLVGTFNQNWHNKSSAV